MKREMFRKLMAASLATVMTMSLAACGATDADTPASSESKETPASSETKTEESSAVEESSEEELGAYTVLKDANGNVYDLGGMHVVIRNWWSDAEGNRPEAQSEYDEARWEYVEWCEQTYNFTVTEQAISDWGSAPADFVDYVTTGGDDNNYVFVLRDDPATTSAMGQGLMYDLSTLDCLDFSDAKFQRNKLHEQYAKGGKTLCMYAGYSEPRTGMYFNKRLLTEAGIDPESIYDMQKAGTWTWDAWTELMDKVQKDADNDGVIDVAGFDANYGVPVSAAVYSNGSEYVGLENGKYTYKFEDPATVEALEWMVDCFKKYALVRPADAQWDYYKEAFLNGQCAFMPDDAYCAAGSGNFLSVTEDEIGFVMFPKGPQASDYTNCWSNNPAAIPACYDADKAWKIAFAYNCFTEDVPGYEDQNSVLTQYRDGNMDDRAVSETCTMMCQKGMVTYHGLIPNLDMGAPFLWAMGPFTESVNAILEGNRDTYKAYIDEANK